MPREAGMRDLFWACDTWCVGPVSRIAERSPPVDGAQASQVQGGSPEKNTEIHVVPFLFLTVFKGKHKHVPCISASLGAHFILTYSGFYDNSHIESLAEISRCFYTYLTQEPQWREQCEYLQTFGGSGGACRQQRSLQ